MKLRSKYQVKTERESSLGRGNSRCKGPEAGMCTRDRRKTTVTGASWGYQGEGRGRGTLCWAWQVEFSSVPLLIHAQLFATPWTAARQASLSITNSQSFLKLMSIELVMPSNHLILCCSLLLPSVFPSIRVFYNESVLCIR